MKRINVYTVELVKEKGGLYDLENTRITSPDEAHEIIEKVFSLSKKPKEHFGILTLSTKNTVLGAHIIHIGSLNASIVHPREVYQMAILNNSAGIIAFHNHPSGSLEASPEDIEVTKRLYEAGKIIGIDLMDHLIIGRNGVLSMKTKGLF